MNRAELFAELGIDPAVAGPSGWVGPVACPACPTGSVPSLRINVRNAAYRCHRCQSSSGSGQNLEEFFSSPVPPSLASTVGARPGLDQAPPLTEDLIERYHRMLMDAPSALKDLERVRGWNADTLTRLKIGWDGAWFWLPVRDPDGKIVNARLYDPFKRTNTKSFHYAHQDTRRTVAWCPNGKASLESHRSVWMFEGEPDAILAAQMGFPTLVITGGAGTWTDEVLQFVEDREVVLCYDVDAAGRRGAQVIRRHLEGNGKHVIDFVIPLGSSSHKDFTDAVQKEMRDAAWFKAQIKSLRESGGAATTPPAPPPVVKLGDGSPGEPVVVKAHVLGTDSTPALVPSMIEGRCRRNWNQEACGQCPLNQTGGLARANIGADSRDLLLLAATGARGQELDFKRLTGAPARCPRVAFTALGWWQVQQLRLVPPMSERMGGESTIRAALFVCQADGRPATVRANQLYVFNGRIEPDVVTNEWTLVSSDARAAEDDVESFVLTDEIYDEMSSVFCPNRWTVDDVARTVRAETLALSRHVTKVYGRPELLELIDFTYHSVVKFAFRGSAPARGWLSMGIIGDTRTGKSETASNFSTYLGMGKFVMDPANTTYAGLVGGLQQVGKGDKSWTVTWGLIPSNDKKLVFIDEISSLTVDDIGKMSGMRSSGIAEITKIRNSSTPARTRTVFSGNPRGVGRTLSSYGTPVEGWLELIGAPEDIARFDAVMGVKSGLDKEAADRALGVQPLPAPLDLRRTLVKFAWSRQPGDITWEAGAEDLCVEVAGRLIKDYDHSIPIVEPSEQDVKVARLAVSIAVRTFSVVKSAAGVYHVVVRKCHVEFAERVMRAAFDGDLGYSNYSAFRRRNMLDEAAATQIIARQGNVAACARALLAIRRVTPNSVAMATGLDNNEVRTFITGLAQAGAAKFDDTDSRNQHMVWTPAFMGLLRKIEVNPESATMNEVPLGAQF